MTDMPNQCAQLTVFLAAFFVVWTFRATLFFAVDESIASPIERAAYSNLLKLLLWVLPAAAFGYRLRSTPPPKYLGVSAKQFALGFSFRASHTFS